MVFTAIVDTKTLLVIQIDTIQINNSIVINPQRNWNAKLYGMCLFNKSLDENDVKYLNS